jgi:hypothetical protein
VANHLDAALARVLTGQAPVRDYGLTLRDLNAAERSLAAAVAAHLHPPA